MDSTPPRVGIVVLNYNGQDCLLACLESLGRLEYSNYFVVVVDNASQDNSLALARARFPEHVYIGNSKNLGFAGGMNVGMRAVFSEGASWAWLFNNDAIAEPSTLSKLIATGIEESRIGLLSPSIFDVQTKQLWFGKGKIRFFRMRVEHILPSKGERERKTYPSEFLTGCALLVRRAVFEEVGDLDEHFFLYYEDADFSVRAQKAGFRVLVASEARVYHGEQSRKNMHKLYHLVYSGLLFFTKHANGWGQWYFLVYGRIRRLKNAVDCFFGREGAQVVRRAYHDFYHGF